jgi:hypothetical protein
MIASRSAAWASLPSGIPGYQGFRNLELNILNLATWRSLEPELLPYSNGNFRKSILLTKANQQLATL